MTLVESLQLHAIQRSQLKQLLQPASLLDGKKTSALILAGKKTSFFSGVRNILFSTYAQFSEKRLFLSPVTRTQHNLVFAFFIFSKSSKPYLLFLEGSMYMLVLKMCKFENLNKWRMW